MTMNNIKFYRMFEFGSDRQIGELKYDGGRKERKWTALLTNTGIFGGVEFFARVGDYWTSQEAEKALRAEEERRLLLAQKDGK